MIRRAIALSTLALLPAACGGTTDVEVRGVVVDVRGTLTEIESFEVRSDRGETYLFVPSNDAVFGDEAPLSHIRDHLRSGEPVVVTYSERDGELVADRVDDG